MAARAGHAVAVHCNRSVDEARALVEELRANGASAAAVQADLARDGIAEQLVAGAADALGGPLTAIANNASQFLPDTAARPDEELARRLWQVNYQAPVSLVAALARQLHPDGDAVAVNILDQKLWNLNPDFFSYTASKAALETATQMMAMAHAPRLRVNAIAPGILFPSHDQSEREFRKAAPMNPMGRPIDVDEVGRAFVYVLQATSLTGQVIHADNGQRLMRQDRDVMYAVRGGE